MASEELKLRVARQWVAYNYPADNADKLAELKDLANSTFASASKTIQVTSGSFEGGGGNSVIVFEKIILAAALFERLAEIDPNYVPPTTRSGGTLLSFEPGCVL